MRLSRLTTQGSCPATIAFAFGSRNEQRAGVTVSAVTSEARRADNIGEAQWPQQPPFHAAEEEERQEDENDDQRREDNGTADFRARAIDDFERR